MRLGTGQSSIGIQRIFDQVHGLNSQRLAFASTVNRGSGDTRDMWSQQSPLEFDKPLGPATQPNVDEQMPQWSAGLQISRQQAIWA